MNEEKTVRDPFAPPTLEGLDDAARAQVDEAFHALRAGNFVELRRLATTLLRHSDEAVRRVGDDLARRAGVDPVAVAIHGACLVLVLIAAWIYGPL